MSLQTWPLLNGETSNSEIANKLELMDHVREDDISQFDNLNQVFVSGRSAKRIAPTSSADILGTDKVGDIVYAADGSYRYDLLLVSGSPAWRRVALAAW